MTAPIGPVVLGPGVLKIGATATLVDVSCLVNACTIETTKDQGDTTWKLCGTSRPGAITYSYEMNGNVDIDPSDPDGLFMLSQEAAGTEQDYVFTPNTAAGATAAGQLIIDPLSFGGDTYGETMTSDFAFALTGAPTYSAAPPALDEPAGDTVAA